MALSLEETRTMATQLATDISIFWLAFSGDPQPDCDRELHNNWQCCDYHRTLTVKSAEWQALTSKLQDSVQIFSEAQVGSPNWWEQVFDQLQVPMPEVMKIKRRVSRVSFFAYIYREKGMEVVFWELENHSLEETLEHARLAVPAAKYEEIRHYAEQLINKYGLDHLRTVLKEKFNSRGSRFTLAYQALPV